MKATGIKGLIVGLLVLLQTALFAQSDSDTTIYESVDSLVEVTVPETYQSEIEPERIAPLPDTPVFRSVPDSIIRDLQRRKEFAYANDPSYWISKKPKGDSSSWIDWIAAQRWFKYLILSLMIGLLLFAIIKIAVSNRLLVFKSRGKDFVQEEQELLNQTNFDQVINEAEAANNFRLALRYRYLKTLKEMDARQIIQLNAQSTNWDYVNRMGMHPLKKQFQLLTRTYEYVWYGELEITEPQYAYWKEAFMQFEKEMG